MRRVFIISVALALFLSVVAGVAMATDVGWRGNVAGEMVADDGTYDGMVVDFDVRAKPTNHSFVQAQGWGHYEYLGNAFRLRVTRACVNELEGAVAVWGHARVMSGSFDGGALVAGDKAYGILSLFDNGDDTVSARAVISADFFPDIPDVVAVNCEPPFSVPAPFPATGLGTLEIIEK